MTFSAISRSGRVASKPNSPLPRVTKRSTVFSERISSMLGISGKGCLKEGMDADLTVIDPDKEFTVKKEDIAYKCGWSPYEGMILNAPVEMVFIGGDLAVKDGRTLLSSPTGKPLIFR